MILNSLLAISSAPHTQSPLSQFIIRPILMVFQDLRWSYSIQTVLEIFKRYLSDTFPTAPERADSTTLLALIPLQGDLNDVHWILLLLLFITLPS